jgi:fructuronate reductase
VSTPRLSAATLVEEVAQRPSRNQQSPTGPLVDPAALSIGIVHFGIGAFHRAHQAVFTEDAAAASGDTRWGILGVTGRSDTVVRQLQPQDCLYGVLERGADATSLRLIGSVRDVAWPGRDSERVVEQLARPTTHVATLTITEKGYLRGADGELDLSLGSVRHDVAVLGRELAGESELPASLTPLGLLVRGLARRFRSGGEPFTVVACDNLVDNGPTTRRLVQGFAAAATPTATPVEEDATKEHPSRNQHQHPFAAWLAASVTFPSTMVDRIAPATTEGDRALAEEILGLRDEALVVAEPFKQWVIEDDFAGPRPAWEQAGAILTSDVAAYERVKLRVLNGTHSMLAYLGALKGHDTIAQAVTDVALHDAVLRVLNDDILPTLQAPPGLDLEQYRDSVLQRFANPNLAHTTGQVGMDGSQKLPFRFVSTAADRMAAGHLPEGLAFALAAWISYIASTSDAGGPVLDDPLATRLQAAIGTSVSLAEHPDAAVDRLFAINEVFTAEVRASSAFRAAVVAALPQVRALTRPAG